MTTSAPRRWGTRSALCSRAVSTLSCLAGHAGPQADGAAPHACLGRRGIGGGGAQEGTARRTSGEALRLHAEAARTPLAPQGPSPSQRGRKGAISQVPAGGPELRVSSPDAHCRNQGPIGEATPQLGSPERAAAWLCCSEWSATRSSPEAKGSGCLAVYRVKGAAERPTRRPRGRGTRR